MSNDQELNDWDRSYTEGALASWESAEPWVPDCLGRVTSCPLVGVYCPYVARCATPGPDLGPAPVRYQNRGDQ